MLMSRVLAISLLVLSPAAFADSLNVNLNNNAAQFQFNGSASDFIEGNSEIHGGILYNDVNNLFFDAGLLVKGGSEDGNSPGLSVGVGVKGVFGSIHTKTTSATVPPVTTDVTNTVSAIGVGGELVFALPTPTRVAVVGEYYASPKIMSFADSERFNQFGIRLEVEVSPQANVYIGYREIGFGIKGSGTANLDKGTNFGVIVSF
jgi:hypothetical protein